MLADLLHGGFLAIGLPASPAHRAEPGPTKSAISEMRPGISAETGQAVHARSASPPA